MSQNPVPIADTNAAPPHANGVPCATECDLTPEAKAALVARAKDVIAGRIPPPPIIAPLAVEEFMQREYANYDPPPTAAALRDIREDLSLQAIYAGVPVACFTMPGGFLAVLGVGEQEIWAILKGLSDQEQSKVVVMPTI